jgi:hypothetical protein
VPHLFELLFPLHRDVRPIATTSLDPLSIRLVVRFSSSSLFSGDVRYSTDRQHSYFFFFFFFWLDVFGVVVVVVYRMGSALVWSRCIYTCGGPHCCVFMRTAVGLRAGCLVKSDPPTSRTDKQIAPQWNLSSPRWAWKFVFSFHFQLNSYHHLTYATNDLDPPNVIITLVGKKEKKKNLKSKFNSRTVKL